MPEFNPFDMDLDGDVDGIDFLGFDCLMRRVLRPDEDKRDDDERGGFGTEDEWGDDDATENDY